MGFVFKKLSLMRDHSLRATNRFKFKKLIVGDFVSLRDGFGFKKLSETTLTPIPSGFDLSILDLAQGEYTITVTAISEGLTESKHSNSVIYTIK